MNDLDPAAFTDREQLHDALLELMGKSKKTDAVAAEIHLSRATIYELRNGKRDFTLHSLTAIVNKHRPDKISDWVAAWKRLYAAEPGLAGSSAGMLPPRQLPLATTPFVGRTGEIAELSRLAEPRPGTRATVCVTGMGGLGKTELVIQWARIVADRYPDGCLFLDLRGYDAERPVTPADALLSLLRDLGDTGDVPLTEGERVKRYHAMISGRRMLLIFDNVRDPAQVQLLLPPTETCVTVLTSRDDLTGLHVLFGTRRIALQPLAAGDASRLFDQLAAPVAMADSEVLAELVTRCSGLPLALRIAGGLAAGRPLRATEGMLQDLIAGGRPLEIFQVGAGRTDLRDVFSWTYRALDDGSAQSFRLLSMHPGRTFDTYAVTALTDADVPTARRRLEMLRRFGLVHDRSDTHFGMHDLLRDYSHELGETAGFADERSPALSRLLGHYLAGAQAAEAALYARRVADTSAVPPSTPLPPFADARAAREWLDRERPNLVAVAVEAAHTGHTGLTCALADAIWLYLHEGGHYLEAVTVHGHAAEAAHIGQHRSERAIALDHLGIAYQLQGDYQRGLDCLTEALELNRLTGNRVREGEALTHLGTVYARWGRYAEAADHMTAGLTIAEEVGDETGKGNTLNNLGLNYQKWGRYVEALAYLNRAVDDAERRDNQATKAIALNNRCLVHTRLGQHDEARRDVDEALMIVRSTGLSGVEGQALDTLGALLLATGKLQDAQGRLEEALAMHREAGDRAAEALCLHHLGHLRFAEGMHHEALQCQQQATGIAQEIGERGLETNTRNAWGTVLRALDQHNEAAEQYDMALALASQTGNRDDEAAALLGNGHIAAASGDRATARERWTAALLIYEELSLPDADTVRSLLRDI